jgi:hypothetical protein
VVGPITSAKPGKRQHPIPFSNEPDRLCGTKTGHTWWYVSPMGKVL